MQRIKRPMQTFKRLKDNLINNNRGMEIIEKKIRVTKIILLKSLIQY